MTGPMDAEYKETIEKTLDYLRSLIDNNDCAQNMLTLAWHNAGKNDAQSKTGESNDSIRSEEEYSRDGLKIALDLCEGVKAKHPKITYTDLHQLACIVAVEVIGGPLISFVPGKEDFKIFKDRATSYKKLSGLGFNLNSSATTPVATVSAPNQNQEVQTLQLFEEDVVSDTGYIGGVYSGKIYLIAKNQSFDLEERNVTLESRTFEIGDIVSCIRDTRKQQGVGLSVNQQVDLSASADDAGLYNIAVGELERIRTVFVGDIVVKCGWIGIVSATELAVTVEFSDGSKISDIDPDPQFLIPEFTNALEMYLDTPYYLGQSVSQEMYVHGKITVTTGKVTKHRTQVIHVDWIQPTENQLPERLRPNSVSVLRPQFYAHAAWRLGQRCRLNGYEYVISNFYPTSVMVQWKCGLREEIDGRVLTKVDTLERFFEGNFQICDLVQIKEVTKGLPVYGLLSLINTNTVVVDWADGTTTTVDPKDIETVKQPDEKDDGYEENDGDTDSNKGGDSSDGDAAAEEENNGGYSSDGDVAAEKEDDGADSSDGDAAAEEENDAGDPLNDDAAAAEEENDAGDPSNGDAAAEEENDSDTDSDAGGNSAAEEENDGGDSSNGDAVAEEANDGDTDSDDGGDSSDGNAAAEEENDGDSDSDDGGGDSSDGGDFSDGETDLDDDGGEVVDPSVK